MMEIGPDIPGRGPVGLVWEEDQCGCPTAPIQKIWPHCPN